MTGGMLLREGGRAGDRAAGRVGWGRGSGRIGRPDDAGTQLLELAVDVLIAAVDVVRAVDSDAPSAARAARMRDAPARRSLMDASAP